MKILLAFVSRIQGKVMFWRVRGSAERGRQRKKDLQSLKIDLAASTSLSPHSPLPFLLLFLLLARLGIEPRASCMRDKHSTAELQPSSQIFFFFTTYLFNHERIL